LVALRAAVGAVLSGIIGLVSRWYFRRSGGAALLNPLRWPLLMAYALGPFFIAMAKANLDIAYRVLTGRIRPGLRTGLGITMLVNSITLTPEPSALMLMRAGTSSTCAGNVREGLEREDVVNYKHVCGTFHDWVRGLLSDGYLAPVIHDTNGLGWASCDKGCHRPDGTG